LTEAAAGGFDCPMRVMVTGGTGFLGSHAVKALTDAGHDVRLLVRSPARIAPALAPHGLDHVDHVVGDVTDVASVERALEGCDAVLHAANVYTLDPRRAEEMRDVNPRGTANVLRAAHERGADPIVHVSSNAALMPSPGRPLTPESPLGDPPGAYSQSKVEAERIARGLQSEGAPVVIVNPVGLLGPHDPHLGDFTAVARDVLRGRLPFVVAGTTPMVDVRDVATVTAALMEPGRGPRRYMASGGYVTMRDFATEASQLTRRRIPAVALPGRPMLAVGRGADWIQRRLGVRLPLNYEGPWFMVYGAKVDVSATERDLKVRFRAPAETLADTYRWLCEAGLVSRRQAGALAPSA
jgi:dihydroflavonol-4-reductase